MDWAAKTHTNHWHSRLNHNDCDINTTWGALQPYIKHAQRENEREGGWESEREGGWERGKERKGKEGTRGTEWVGLLLSIIEKRVGVMGKVKVIIQRSVYPRPPITRSSHFFLFTV